MREHSDTEPRGVDTEPRGVDGEPRGVLVLAGVPLGNPADAAQRLRDTLANADIVAAEDTRRVRRLASDLGVRIVGRVVSYFEANEATRTLELVKELEAGRRVLLVTDAGMPSAADPGYRLVVAAVAADIAVTCLPGPSAVTTALALSGLPVDRFCFEGFLPRRASERKNRLETLRWESRTMIFFEAPHRLEAMLTALVDVLGRTRPATVCRELTKTYEQVKRGTLSDLAAWAALTDVKGEITIVVQGNVAAPKGTYEPAELVQLVEVAEVAGMTRKEAVVAVGKSTGAGRRAVYEALVARKHDE